MKRCAFWLIFFMAFAAAGPACASIEENYKENVNRFETAREFFLSGKTPECAGLLQEIMLDSQQAGIYDHLQASRLLGDGVPAPFTAPSKWGPRRRPRPRPLRH